MSRETSLLFKPSKTPEAISPEALHHHSSSLGRTASSNTSVPVQQVWCAPIGEAGEWVVTWTRLSGARLYEVQTSADAAQWSNSCQFSGTRAVLLIGRVRHCWVRVRGIGPGGPGAWSQPAEGENEDR